MNKKKEKFTFNATWSMAVGGMVGGGIFSVLGVIISRAGQWAWLSFTIAGIIALISAHSYNQLSIKFKKGGGAFTFLEEMRLKGLAASLSWVLILGYILTLSVYAFTFGHYVAHVVNAGSWLPRALALSIILFLAWINLRGVGDSSRLEIITVWGKLIVLLGVAAFGIIKWEPQNLTAGIDSKPWHSAITGAAIIFMAYEGFQLLSYDYKDIRKPEKTLPRATLTAVICVILIYILVAFGATMIVGAGSLIEKEEIALSVAGQQAIGVAGLIIVTIAAAFSTGSAINATLFSTARLMESVSLEKDLPSTLSKENKAGVPQYAIISIAAFATVLAVIGSLGSLVESASLIFLITFGTVNFIAWYEGVRYKYLSLAGVILIAGAIILSTIDQIEESPVSLIVIVVIILSAFLLRPLLIKRIRSK